MPPYAKTGTTWMQQFVAQMRFGGDPTLPVAGISLWLARLRKDKIQACSVLQVFS
ncbi:MAG: hypothetical protein ACYCZT_12465 [Thiobacillus sp.]